MVIGKGLLGTAFSSYINNDAVLIFASGVSNSRASTADPFQRELDLLNLHTKFNGLLVYFSTCSILDNTLKSSPYIQHKLKIEQFIADNFRNYLIVRLPNVVGSIGNPNTMLNFFSEAINSQSPLQLQRNSHRYFIDIDDVYFIVDSVIKNNEDIKITQNLVITDKTAVKDVVDQLELHLGKKTKRNYIDGDSNYMVQPGELFESYLHKYSTGEIEYLKKLIKKYY